MRDLELTCTMSSGDELELRQDDDGEVRVRWKLSVASEEEGCDSIYLSKEDQLRLLCWLARALEPG